MEEFVGIPSLFIACLEYLLLINALVFGQKNKVNIIALIIITVYSTNHLIEFFICQFNFTSHFFVFINFAIISLLPPLSLLLVLKFWRHETKLQYLIFLPSILILYFFMVNIESFNVTEYFYLYVTYSYLLRTEFGIYYYIMNLAALLFLIAKLREPKLRYKRHLNIALIIAFGISVIFPLLLLLLFPSLNIYAESILNKFTFFYVLGLAYFSLKNKTEFLSEKG